MSPPPQKAELWPLKEPNGQGSGGAKRLVVDDARPKVVVQFNPASLKITRRGNTDRGGVTTLTEHRQSPSAEPATLTFDLEFDTAEGGDDGQAQDVREKNQAGPADFIEPPDTNTGEAPPRVRFMWGTFIFDGIVSHITEDLDYFSADGTALRAKLSLEITEQDLKFEQDAKGAGARGASNATPPGGGPVQAGPGAPPAANPAQSAAAQAGESVQQLLTRLGADPSGWRTAMTGLGSPLALAAGQEVLLGAAVPARGGIGVSAGCAVEAGHIGRRITGRSSGRGLRRTQAGASAAASPAGAPGEGATAAATVTGAPAVVVAARVTADRRRPCARRWRRDFAVARHLPFCGGRRLGSAGSCSLRRAGRVIDRHTRRRPAGPQLRPVDTPAGESRSGERGGHDGRRPA